MNKEHVNQITNNLISIYEKNNLKDKLKWIEEKPLSEPFFKPSFFHQEGEINANQVNLIPIEIYHDITLIDNSIKHAIVNYNNLLINSRSRLLDIEKEVIKAKEYKNDMQLYESENIDTITDKDCYGNFDYKDGCFFCKSIDVKEAKLDVVSVIGNGYEGNDYVFDPRSKNFLSTINPTRDSSNLFSNLYSTPYEYSRINISINEDNAFHLANEGDTKAECIITLHSNDKIGALYLVNYGEEIELSRLEYSDDNLNYKDTDIKENIFLEKTVVFPKSNYVRLHFKALSYTKEIIAYSKNNISPKGEVTYDNFKTNDIKIVSSGKRSRISLARISAHASEYVDRSMFKTRELIKEGEVVSSIAIDVDEVYPNKKSEDSIKYYLIVNGKAQELVPINSNKDGVKIIKSSKRTYSEERSIFIDEDIRSAFLHVEIRTNDKRTSPAIRKLNILKH